MSGGLSGVVVIGKPAGMTSFDVVGALRRALGVRRVGHAGTLDPDATGVLPILLGEATKLMPYLADQDKEYRVTIRFGMTTDTLDIGGRVLSTHPGARVTRADVEGAAARFIGAIRQVPPMYSARHHAGRRLYELARAGVEVEREPRDVLIHGISVEDVADATATLAVVCGKGTYIRVLAADLGEVLDVGGCVERLVRTRVGPFRLDEAVSWDAVARRDTETLRASVKPPEAALASWPATRLAPAMERAFVSGQAVAVAPTGRVSGLLRVHAADGPLIGIGEVVVGGRVRPIRILHVDRPGSRVLPA